MQDHPLIPEVNTPTGTIKVAVDQKALNELSEVFRTLGALKQEWLLTRFPHCETDTEATKLVNDGHEPKRVADRTLKDWKLNDREFRRAYDLMSSRLVDWVRHLVMTVETGTALLAALEVKKMVQMPWKGLGAREVTAKMQAIQATLDRVIPAKQAIDVNLRHIADLLPQEE